MKVVKEIENGDKKLYVLHEIPNLSLSEEEYRDLIVFAKEKAGNNADYIGDETLRISYPSYETINEDHWIISAKEELVKAESNYRLYAFLYKIFKALIISEVNDEINRLKGLIHEQGNEIAKVKVIIDKVQKKRKRKKNERDKV